MSKQTKHCHIPKIELEALARCLLPDIQAYFKSETGKWEFEKWKAEQEQNQRKVAQD